MTQLTLEMPEEALATLHKDPREFTQELRVAAAVKWYEMELVSQCRAAEIAGLSRADFLDALFRYRVSPFQYTAGVVVLAQRLGLMPSVEQALRQLQKAGAWISDTLIAELAVEDTRRSTRS